MRAHRDPARARNLRKNATPLERAEAHRDDANALRAWSQGKRSKREIAAAEKKARKHDIAANHAVAEIPGFPDIMAKHEGFHRQFLEIHARICLFDPKQMLNKPPSVQADREFRAARMK